MNLPKPYYQDSAVTLYHGDSRQILPLLGRFDLLLTDPPYGVGMDYGDITDDGLLIKNVVVPLVVAALVTCDRAIITPGTRFAWLYPNPDDIGAAYFPAGNGFSSWGFRCSQPILFYGKDPHPSNRKRPNSVSITQASDECGHPCPKPFQWINWMVNRGSLEGHTVLDPFAGSGTTGRACKDLGRKCVMIEREERYCEIAARRMGQEVLNLTQ
jgi:site-specific DNA-methyltransferase (adenine-specific)